MINIDAAPAIDEDASTPINAKKPTIKPKLTRPVLSAVSSIELMVSRGFMSMFSAAATNSIPTPTLASLLPELTAVNAVMASIIATTPPKPLMN